MSWLFLVASSRLDYLTTRPCILIHLLFHSFVCRTIAYLIRLLTSPNRNHTRVERNKKYFKLSTSRNRNFDDFFFLLSLSSRLVVSPFKFRHFINSFHLSIYINFFFSVDRVCVCVRIYCSFFRSLVREVKKNAIWTKRIWSQDIFDCVVAFDTNQQHRSDKLIGALPVGVACQSNCGILFGDFFFLSFIYYVEQPKIRWRRAFEKKRRRKKNFL